MGDRGNVRLKFEREEDNDIYFYSHWCGSELENIVRKALARKQRWDDESYLARIIFSQMIMDGGKGCIEAETGLGIAPYEIDSGPLITIDMKNQTVTVRETTWAFEDFIKGTPNED